MYKHFDGRFSVLTCTKDGLLLTETHLHVRMYTYMYTSYNCALTMKFVIQ